MCCNSFKWTAEDNSTLKEKVAILLVEGGTKQHKHTFRYG